VHVGDLEEARDSLSPGLLIAKTVKARNKAEAREKGQDVLEAAKRYQRERKGKEDAE